MLRLILVLLLFTNNIAFEVRLGGKLYRFDKFAEPCHNETASANYKISLNIIKKTLIFDFDIYIHEIVEKTNLELIFERCSSRETLDTCQIIRALNTNKGCFLIGVKKQVWTPVIECTHPKPICPLQGKYNGINCTMDMSVFNYIPLGRYYWRAKGIISTTTGATLVCLAFEGQVIKNY